MTNLKGIRFPLLANSAFQVKRSTLFPVASTLLAVTFSVAPFSHKSAIAQATEDEFTVMMCETDSTAVRVYEKAGELVMRAYSRTQNDLWMTDTPAEMQSLAEGTEYRNLQGERIATVNANATTDDCTIQIDAQLAETGSILERGAPTTTPDPTTPDPTTPDPTTPDPTTPDAETPEPAEPGVETPEPTTPDPTEPDAETPEPTEPDASLPDEVEAAVKAALATEIGDMETTVDSYSPQTWSDGCLGLGGPADSCLAALTEGWQVEMMDSATGDRYTYRTNEDGSDVRLDENASLSTSN